MEEAPEKNHTMVKTIDTVTLRHFPNEEIVKRKPATPFKHHHTHFSDAELNHQPKLPNSSILNSTMNTATALRFR